MGETDVFSRAQTYGSFDGIDSGNARGESSWNYTNGDGVLFYPGKDRHTILHRVMGLKAHLRPFV